MNIRYLVLSNFTPLRRSGFPFVATKIQNISIPPPSIVKKITPSSQRALCRRQTAPIPIYIKGWRRVPILRFRSRKIPTMRHCCYLEAAARRVSAQAKIPIINNFHPQSDPRHRRARISNPKNGYTLLFFDMSKLQSVITPPHKKLQFVSNFIKLVKFFIKMFV